jgi:uncharacterized protein YjbI with pentapeptide repeats
MSRLLRILGIGALLALATSAQASTLLAWGDYTGTSHVDENHQNETLNNIILDAATLSGTNFRRTIFDFGSFVGANFDNSATSATNLSQTSFVGANLTDASLQGVNLNGADFSGANLAGANFSGATNGTSVDWTGATFTSTTILPPGVAANPSAFGLILAEPSTALMLAGGLGGLALLGSRASRRA